MGAHGRGCITCKKRRVKCDETHPYCTRCQKSNYTCGGYPLAIVDEKPRIQRACKIAELQQRDASKHQPLQQSLHIGYLESARPNLPLTAFKDNIVISFLVSKMLEGRPPCYVSRGSTGTASEWWISGMVKTPNKPLDALATMYFGQTHGLSDIFTDSLKLYGEALQDLRVALLNSDAVWLFETLAATTALCMYELIACRSGFGWIMHADGLGRLMELRGPTRHKKFPEKSVFLEHRCIIISRAILSRRRTFLGRTEWKEIPWEDTPELKQPVDFLMDIMCDSAALLADIRKGFKQHQENDIIELLRVRTIATLQELNFWWLDWRKKHPETCKEVYSDAKHTNMVDSEGLLFYSLLVYDHFWTGYTLCIHHATRILLLQALHILSHDDFTPSNLCYDPASSSILGNSFDTTELAIQIIRSIEYCYVQSKHFLGTACFVLPLDVAYECLEKNSREARWLQETKMIKLPKITGFAVERPAVKVGSDESPGTGLDDRLLFQE